MTVEALKVAIAELSQNERHSLAAWLIELEFDEWDKQMVKDFSPGARGMELADRVKRDIAADKASPFEEGMAEARQGGINRNPLQLRGRSRLLRREPAG